MAQESSSKHVVETLPVGDASSRPARTAPPPIPAQKLQDSLPPPIPPSRASSGLALPGPAPDPGQADREAKRRTAKRRPAGPSRPNIAANDDTPSIGGLIFALHQKPSRRPLEIAGMASGVWLLVSLLLGWAMLAPELQRAPSIWEMLTRPTAITLAATIILPIALFWLLGMLVWRAQELRLMSSAMTEVAIRLAEPDRMAEQQIASVGQAVRRQVSFMDEAIARALGRAGELEALVHNEVSNLERSYSQNEQRIRSLLNELSGERNALLNTSERVNVSLREIGTEIPSLVEKLGEQQIKLARFIEDAGRNLVSLESSLAGNANNLARTVGEQTTRLETVLTGKAADMERALTAGTEQLRLTLDQRAEAMHGGFVDRIAELEGAISNRTQLLESAISNSAGRLEGLMSEHGDRIEAALGSQSEGIEALLNQRTEGLQAVLEEYTRALDSALHNRQEALGGMLQSRQQSFDAQLVERTKALDEAFAERTRVADESFTERLKLFDDAIVRSTIAVDSMVADKARALTSALELHAKEISQVLGRQAGDLDEQLMHGVNAVRRASENVTRQSLKAIEGLAGQADMLKNVSENLVNQISGVTKRFDQQGQVIMSAANALESANYRIDKTLQARQQDLHTTLDQLSNRTGDIDRVLLGYSNKLEGTFTEAEARARSVGDQLSRSAAERAEQLKRELQMLQSATQTETDRSLADLRHKYSSITREVNDEIGALSSRFSETSDVMRQHAQKTLAEIEAEQARLRAQIDRLPEVTRTSADNMRSSLQEQIKALEQLSALSARESARADISPPLPAQAALPSSQPAQMRSISSVTQSLATELAGRTRQADGLRTAPPVATGQAQTSAASATPGAGAAAGGRDGWSLGDLLARASQEEGNRPAATQVKPAAPSPLPAQSAAAAQNPIDVQAIAKSLDATTASAIWSRFRAGQRGIMVRSIYTNEGRAAFDEIQRRYRGDAGFQQTVDRYMADFEQVLREADQRDPSGRTGQSYIITDSGRVYLFLAHASGRLA